MEVLCACGHFCATHKRVCSSLGDPVEENTIKASSKSFRRIKSLIYLLDDSRKGVA